VKKIIAVLLAVVLVAAGLGSFAYAQVNGHEPMTGQKLVGMAALGHFDSGQVRRFAIATLGINNPDCVAEITIEKMVIIGEDGSVVYEGPFLRTPISNPSSPDPPEQMTRPLKPHEGWECFLASCIPDGEGGWLPADEVLNRPRTQYMVEIFWSGHKKGLPLGGGITPASLTVSLTDGQILSESFSVVIMGHMEQKLGPEE
jgi:hypothetical protein